MHSITTTTSVCLFWGWNGLLKYDCDHCQARRDMNPIEDKLSQLQLLDQHEPKKKKKKMVPKGTRKKNQEMLETQCGEHFKQYFESLLFPRNKIRFRKYCIHDFDIFCLLGSGGFGKVFLCKLKETRAYFALKTMGKKQIMEEDDYDSVMMERKIMIYGNQSHFICQLFACFQTKRHLCFAMQFCCGGDLKFHLYRRKRFDEDSTRFYICETVCAINYLHRLGIIYRDLKLENIMINFDGHIKLVDFGLCIGKAYREDMRPSDFCGTMENMAPEVTQAKKYNQAVDFWSLGIILYEMIVGCTPFQGTDEEEICWNICNLNVSFPSLMQPTVKDLIRLLLIKNGDERLGTPTSPHGKLSEHSFFRPIDWNEVESRKLVPPWIPKLSSLCDISFTIRRAPKTIAALQASHDNQDQPGSSLAMFADFDYTNAEMF